MPYDRRKFNELSAAALGGLVAGTLAGCGDSAQPDKAGGTPGPAAAERHLCRGLNDCQGQGVSGDNACRGQGDCATLTHACAGKNDCKGQGGCGSDAGANACKGKGGCSVPLMPGAWKTVRDRKTAAWTKAGEKFGEAPEEQAEE